MEVFTSTEEGYNGDMEKHLIAADEIYNVSLQILNENRVDAEAVPLITATAMHRLEAFAIGAMARELSEMKSKEDNENTAEDIEKEVDDGEHIERD